MSVLVVARSLAAGVDVKRTPVAKLQLAQDHLDALASWGITDVAGWDDVEAWHGLGWGDLVNEGANDARARPVLVGALVEIAANSDGFAIWYASFYDDMPIAHSVDELAQILDEQLAAGDLEPAALYLRAPH